jgi:hypothetical protein
MFEMHTVRTIDHLALPDILLCNPHREDKLAVEALLT